MYLLDTNVVSEIRKPRPHGAVLQWIASVSPQDLAVPAVVIAELQAGAEITRRQDPTKAAELEAWIDEILRTFSDIGMDGPTFRHWAHLMAGKTPGLAADAMIAATARLYNYVVATRNVRDFLALGAEVFNPFTYHSEDLV